MRHLSETVDVARPLEDVWRAIGTPERWFDGYVETRSRSADYPGPDTRDDRVYWARRKEQVDARVTRSEAPSVLEDDCEGKTFARHVRHSLTPSNGGTSLRVDDDVRFKGFGKLAVAIATRDINHRWHSSLEKLKTRVEGEVAAVWWIERLRRVGPRRSVCADDRRVADSAA